MIGMEVIVVLVLCLKDFGKINSKRGGVYCLSISTGTNGYNTYDNLPNIPYNIMTYLFSNDNLFKLLKYADADALSKPNLSNSEKASLIYNGETDSTSFRLFQDSFTDDAYNVMCSMIRIFPYFINPINRTSGIVDIVLEAITHVKVNYLDNYKTRIPYMTQQIIASLNGKEVGALGVISFDRSISHGNFSKLNISNNRNYVGQTTIMNVRVTNVNVNK